MDFIDIFILQYFGKFYRILQFNTLSVACYTKRISIFVTLKQFSITY